MRDGWRIARRKGIGKLAIELVLLVLTRGFLLWFFVSLGLCVWGHGSLAFRRQAANERTRSATVPSARCREKGQAVESALAAARRATI
jgi:hypothetical protein